MPAENRKFDPVDDFGGLGTGLGELPRDTARAQDRLSGPQTEGPREQIEQRGLPRHMLTCALLRIFGAVPGLQHERFSERDFSQQGSQGRKVVRLDQGGARGQCLAHPIDLG